MAKTSAAVPHRKSPRSATFMLKAHRSRPDILAHGKL